MERRRATITDVAAHAGVSKATVSAVLNAMVGVRDATRQRVLSSAEQLDYRPTARTRAGAPLQRSTLHGVRCLALLIREADNPFYAEVVAGARDAAESHGFTLLVLSSDDGLAPQTDTLIAAVRAKGGKHITTIHAATDHSWSDRRIFLEAQVIRWLQSLSSGRKAR